MVLQGKLCGRVGRCRNFFLGKATFGVAFPLFGRRCHALTPVRAAPILDSRMRPAELIGERFEIEKLAARGGMGLVYRARDRWSDEPVALKMVEAQVAQAVERFAREARVLAELHHPGIVRYLGHGRTGEGSLWLAMEWLEGEDLGVRLGQTELSAAEAVGIATQAAAALAAAHNRRIVHRDIKPSNLFLVDWRSNQTKLLDFGIARLIRGQGVTATGAMIGTPAYMAPEQARDAKDVDARADVFGLGAVLFRCLTGTTPFGGGSTAEALSRLVSPGAAPRLRELRPDLDPDLDDLLARMLAKDPRDRPADAGAVLAELVAVSSDATGAPARHALGGRQRRIVSLVVAGSVLSGSAAELVAAAGGVVQPAPEEVAFVLCAGQRVASDQAAHAARLALSLRRADPELPLAVVTGRVDDDTTAPDVEMLERARALRAAARRGGPVHLDDVTAGLLGSRFRVAGGPDGLELRGEQADEASERLLMGRQVPFVGRDRELALLEGMANACFHESEAHAVLLIAPAGTGKSRLRRELTRRMGARDEPVEIWLGRADPARAGAPFGLLGDAIRRAAGIAGEEPAAAARDLLRRRIARVVAAEEAERVAAFVGEIAGVPFPDDDNLPLRAARGDRALLHDQTRRAWDDWLAAELAVQPVALLLEDLHWGDLPTIKLVDAALKTHGERPLFVLGLARPEVREVFPDLWPARRLHEIHLGELSRRAGERLARLVLGEGHPAAAELALRAGGNPFFLEELIRHSAAGGSGRPDTVLAMLDARIEALDPDARRVVRAASVFGEALWDAGVAALLGEGVATARWLEVLVEEEILEARVGSRFAGTREYAFRHSLLREAAQLTLIRHDLALAHRLAGAWLERVGETEAIVLAEHFERGEQPALAAVWYHRAAEQALAANDPEAAIARADRGAAHGAEGMLLGRLHLVTAEARRWLGQNHDAARVSLLAMRRLPPGSELWNLAAGEAAAATGKLNQSVTLAAIADELVAAGTGHPDGPSAIALLRTASQCLLLGEMARARALMAMVPPQTDPHTAGWWSDTRHWAAFVGGEDAVAVERCHDAIAAFEGMGDRRNACMSRMHLMQVLLHLGRLEEAEPAGRRAIAEADALGLAAAQMGRAFFVPVLLWRGLVDEALALATEAVEGFHQTAQPRIDCSAQLGLGLALAAAGDQVAAERRLRAATAFGMAAFPRWLEAAAYHAQVLLDLGRPDEADLAVAPTLAHFRDGFHLHELVCRVVAAEAKRALGDTDAARISIATAEAAVRERADRLDGVAREQFLRRNPHAARILVLAVERLG